MLSDLISSNMQPRNINEMREKLVLAMCVINTDKIDISKNVYQTFKQRLTKVLLIKGDLYN